MNHAAQDASIGSWLTVLENRLRPVSETAALDAQVVMAHILGKQRAWVLAHCDQWLDTNQIAGIEAMLTRLETREPLPYVLGHWEFYGLDFQLTHAVLIPRPETELLVERAINWLKVHPLRRNAADIGTGSGCIAITLATHIPDLVVSASDISLPSLMVAKANARQHQVAERIEFSQSDLLDLDTQHTFDLICANLPYIPTANLPGLPVSKWEPLLALDGGKDGLTLIRRLMRQAPHYLSAGGLVLLEIEETQGQDAQAIAREVFTTAEVIVHTDLAGRHRLLEIQL